MAWPFTRVPRVEDTSNLISISDPALAGYFGVVPTFAGVNVSEHTALGISAFWRAVMLISGTIAGLPLKTYRDIGDGNRQRVASWVDDPGASQADMTVFQWKETVILHALLHGDAFLAHVYNQAGGLAGAVPIHPMAVSVDWEKTNAGRHTGRKVYEVTTDDGDRRKFTSDTMTQVMGPSLDGLRGLSVIGVARNSLGTTIAGDRAAARTFANGALISGLVTPEDDLEEGDGAEIKASLDRKVSGWENAGDIAFVNRKLRFTPWTMSAEDAQFLQSRQFQVEEVARWTGVPPHLLMQTEKQTSWGTGVESQNRGLSRFTLSMWTGRFEARLSQLLAAPRFVEFDYSQLERATPAEEIRLLLEQIRGGLITVNEARRIRNLPPIEGGDVLLDPKGTATPPKEVAV